jgi:hypothetical protein
MLVRLCRRARRSRFRGAQRYDVSEVLVPGTRCGMTWRWLSVWNGSNARKTIREATTIGALREQGWDIPPLVVVDQSGQKLHDFDVTVAASTALGTPDGREIVDRETFNAKIAGFEESNRKALENALKPLTRRTRHTDAAINAVKDPAIRAALQALIGRKPDPKGGK